MHGERGADRPAFGGDAGARGRGGVRTAFSYHPFFPTHRAGCFPDFAERGRSPFARNARHRAPGIAGKTWPGSTFCSPASIERALLTPPLSIESQLYHPARPAPICNNHGHTFAGGAPIVIAWVMLAIGSGISSSAYMLRCRSSLLAIQVGISIKRLRHRSSAVSPPTTTWGQ